MYVSGMPVPGIEGHTFRCVKNVFGGLLLSDFRLTCLVQLVSYKVEFYDLIDDNFL